VSFREPWDRRRQVKNVTASAGAHRLVEELTSTPSTNGKHNLHAFPALVRSSDESLEGICISSVEIVGIRKTRLVAAPTVPRKRVLIQRFERTFGPMKTSAGGPPSMGEVRLARAWVITSAGFALIYYKRPGCSFE
jgi:hypothetical protein